MSSVAIAAGTPDVAGHRSEADVVRAAAKADRDAFDELYRRHHQVSWRLAQAVAEGDAAGGVVADGFTQALRGVRRQRALAEQPFRSQLLAATYRAGMEPSGSAAVGEAGPADAPTAVMAAFRSLPDRWRAALWLSDVEHLTAASVAGVLGVSAPVAVQLADRGRQGLLTRFAQVGVALPEHLDGVLRPLAGSPPEGLEALVAKRWRSSVVVDPGGRMLPVTEWLARKAPKPLLTACGGLVALGMVGLGVLTVASPPATSGPAAAISAPSLSGPAPTNPGAPKPNELFGPGAPGASDYTGGLTTSQLAAVNPILAGEGSTASLTGTPGNLPSPVPATGTSAGSGATGSGGTGSGATGTGTGGSGGSSGTGGSGSGSGGGSKPTGGSTTSPTTTPIVSTPVATVSTPSSGGASITVGSTSSPVVGATVTPTCTGIQVLNLLTNQCVNPSTTSTTTPGVLNQLGTTVSGTVSNLLGGLG
jgi:DNA-directed RNA polymerase specialized sigma24 family protein